MSEETNQDVTTPTNDDGNYHSFDDLEQSTDSRSDTEVMEEAKKVAAEETKEVVKEAVKEASSEDKVSEKTVEENLEDAGETAVEEIVEEIRKLEAKFGDERLEIPQDAVISVTIDGEEQEISLNDLRNNYSGKVAWDKKFSELGREKQQFSQDKSLVEKYVSDFAALAEKGDHAGAMEYLASLSGQNPLEFRKALRDQIIEEHKAMLEMDETQKQAYELQEENEFLKRQKESESMRSEEQQTLMELQNQIKSMQETHKVSDEELMAAYDELGKEFGDELTLDTIQEYIVASRAYSTVESVLGEASSSMSEEILHDMATVVMQNPDFTSEDIQEIFSEAYPELAGTQKKQPAKKAQKAAKQAKAEEAARESAADRLARNKLEEFFSFDDL
jgi:hypothetical protein